MYKLAIFDFDGTLVDSAPGIIDVMRQVVDEYELHEDILTKWRDLVGVPLGKQMEIIFPNHNEEFWLEVADRYRAIYDGKTIEICPLFPDLMFSSIVCEMPASRFRLLRPSAAHL